MQFLVIIYLCLLNISYANEYWQSQDFKKLSDILNSANTIDMDFYSNGSKLLNENRINNQQSNRVINNPLVISSAAINKPLNINLTEYNRNFEFQNSQFERPVASIWSQFNDSLNFSYVDFHETVNFYSSKFSGPFFWYKVMCNKACKMVQTQYLQNVEIDNSDFFASVSFQQAIFNEAVNFINNDVEGLANFSNTLFNKDVSFDLTEFRGKLDLSGAKFFGHVSFVGTILPAMIDLSNVNKVRFDIDLDSAETHYHHQYTYINLLNTSLNKINFHYNKFRLYFPDDTPYQIRINLYENLLNHFKALHYDNDYEILYREYKAYQYLSTGKYLINFVQKYWWDYGLAKQRIFLWILILIIFFTFINTLFFVPLITQYCPIKFLQKLSNIRIVHVNLVARFIYYFPRAIIFTVFLFFGGFIKFGLEPEHLKTKNLLVNTYLLINVASGFICLFFILEYLTGR